MRTLELLTTESIRELKSIASARAESLLDDEGKLKSLNSLVGEFGLSLAQSKFTIDETIALRIPDGSSWAENHDRENSVRITKALGGLSAARATDERIWTTLSLGVYAEYADARRKIFVNKDDKGSIKTQFQQARLASSMRNRWREHPIARLWWLNFYAQSFEALDADLVRDVLFLNADLQYNLLGRPGVAGHRVLTGALRERLHSDHVQKSAPFKRDRFRSIMKELDFLVGRLAVGAMNKEVADEWVATVFDKCK